MVKLIKKTMMRQSELRYFDIVVTVAQLQQWVYTNFNTAGALVPNICHLDVKGAFVNNLFTGAGFNQQ